MKNVRLVHLTLEQASKALTKGEPLSECDCMVISTIPSYNLRSVGDVVKGLGKVNLNGVSLKPSEPSVVVMITTFGDTMDDAETLMQDFLNDIGYTEKTTK